MGLRERQRRVAREAITDASLELFLQQGYGRTTIDDIADAADMARRSIYNHFESKADILLGVLEDQVAGRAVRSQSDDRATFAAIDDPDEAVAWFGHTTRGILERSLPLLRVAYEAAAHDGDVAKRLEGMEEGRFHAQAFVLQVLSDHDALRTDVDFDYLHRGLWLLAGPRAALDATAAGWTIDDHTTWLIDILQRFLLPATP